MRGLPPLPDCEGPQLHPYQSSGTPEITFLEEIGVGAHGHVFKVRIEGKIFALKVFHYQLPDSDWLTMDPDEVHKIDEKMESLLTAQWHPFNAECRAYGRLKETKKEHLAARCYGYLVLSEEQKKHLEDRFGVNSWWSEDYHPDRYCEVYHQELQQKKAQEERRGLHAMIKEFVHGDAPFGPEHARMMLSDLHQLHRVGIVVYDLKEDAYVAGKLVDFSKAVVVPHIKFDVRLRVNLDDVARSAVCDDLGSLLYLFNEWNEEHEGCPPIECDPFKEMENAVSRLRRGPLDPMNRKEYIDRCFNPRKIKWRTPVPKGRAADRKSANPGTRPKGVSKRKANSKSRKAPR
ncbi:hypothetical protein N0V82_008716 [Gnomoniopsis sp. IMI 355080]|nr:hypothetical protein N0V82_008716 [Gnomoniopsis sp. IMI 355080]